MRPPKSTLHGRYVIERTLRCEERGALYLATMPSLGGKQVAIREVETRSIAPPLREQSLEKLRQEARLAASLHHPALAPTMDSFAEGDSHFVVMAHVGGEGLEAAQARQRGAFAVSTVLDWADQICDILEYLHRHVPPVVLRDFGPANVVLDSGGRVRLFDPGIARAPEPPSSPDHVATGQHPHGSHLRVLGAMLYALLSGIPLGSSLQLLASEAASISLRALNSNVPPDLEAVIHAMMTASPQDCRQAWTQAREALRSISPPAASPGTPVTGGVASVSPACPQDVEAGTVSPTPGDVSSAARSSALVVAVLFVDFTAYSALRADQQYNARVAVNAAMRFSRTLATDASDEHFVDVEAGDSLVAVFKSKLEGPLELALELQELARRTPLGMLAMRMGLHVGTVLVQGDVPLGAAINMGQRVAASGAPGEITASLSYVEMLRPVTSKYDGIFGEPRQIVAKHGKVLTVASVRSSPAGGAASPEPSLYLETVRGTGQGPVARHRIGSRPLVIGRGEACDVRIDDAGVSRRHATLESRDGQLVLRHESATNPTLVNGRSVDGESPVGPGDEIAISARTVLRIVQDP